MALIYLPQELNNNNCVSLQNLNNNFIRVYDSIPVANSSVDYTDFFIDSHYIQRTGVQTFGNFTTNVICENNNNFTTEFWYRNDLLDIMGIYFIIISIYTYVLTRFLKAFRKRLML